MPLPPPDHHRELIHTRHVTCQGWRRADGLFDIEGHITDQKTYAFESQERGVVQPGDFIHQMWVRLTLDLSMEVKAVAAVTDHSPFAICPAITPNFQRLVGLRVGPGWTRAVKERLAGVEGCTHLVELLAPVATTAFQTIGPLLMRQMEEARQARAAQGKPASSASPPPLLDTCHAFSTRGPLVRARWPAFFKDDGAELDSSPGGPVRQ